MGENERIIRTSKKNLKFTIKVIDYLEKEENRIKIIDNGIEYIINSFDDEDDLNDFKRNETQFKKSIHKHLKWIEMHRRNKYSSRSHLKDYKQGDIQDIEIYCNFYTYLIDNINNIKKSKEVIDTLKKYFKFIKDKYCY